MANKPEGPSLLTADDIADWPGLCARLRQHDGTGSSSLAQRIVSHFPQHLRELLSGEVTDFDQARKADCVAALNAALKRRDLFGPGETAKLTVSDEARRLLGCNREDLSDLEVERLNRLLLEASYPQQVKTRQQKPYVGPRSFQKDQREFFFGRDEEADELVSLITAHQAVLFYSQSGAGKTSLVQASLIPKLEQEEHFNVLPPMRVQGQIQEPLKVGKNSNIFVLNALMSGTSGSNHANLEEMTFAKFLAGREQPTNRYGEPCPTVIVFDQFEELFTSYPERWADREGFFAQIGEALEGNTKKGIKGDPLLRAVFCMREDFIAELDPYLSLLPEKLRTCFRLEHLREHKALLAITKPLEKTNRSFAKGVAEQLVENLVKIPSQSMTGTQSVGLYVEPVQLQVVCQTLWDALTPSETVITRKHLDKYGDVSEALSNFYENSIKCVAAATNVKEEDLRKWFGDTLITSEGTRAPVNRGQDNTGGMPNAAVDQLEALRLIKGEWKGTNVRWYELAHDRFIEPIRRSNHKWLASQSRAEQIRLTLEARASQWKPGSSLLEADELIEARQLVRDERASPALRALVDASKATAQRQRIRRLTAVWVSLAVVAGFVSVLAVFAWFQWRKAHKAENQLRSRLLANTAESFLETDPELSVLLGKEALDRFAPTQQATEVVRRALRKLSNVAGVLTGHEKRVTAAAFSPDGRFILTTSDDGTARLWDAKTKSLIKKLGGEGDQNELLFSTYSPDGRFIVTAGRDGVARVWDGTTGAPLRELRGHTNTVNWAAFSSDGKLVATASDDRTARVWKVESGELVQELKGHDGNVHAIAFSSDGLHVATEAADSTARIWDIRTGTFISLGGLTGPKAAIAFSPDGKLLATEGGPDTESGSRFGEYPVTVWDAATGKVKFNLGNHQQFITGVSFSPDGNFIVTTSADNTAQLWEGNGRLVSKLAGHTKAVTAALFSPDNKFLVTASADNTARVWDLGPAREFGVLSGHISLPNGTELGPLPPNGPGANSPARNGPEFGNDGYLVLSGSELRGHSLAVNSAGFSPDGQLLLTASDDKMVRLWRYGENENRRSEGNLGEHSGPVTRVVFNPEGKLVITTDSSRGRGFDQSSQASASGETFLEDVSGTKPLTLARLAPDNADGVLDAAFSPDGNFVATTDKNRVLVWRVKVPPPGAAPKTTSEGNVKLIDVSGVVTKPKATSDDKSTDASNRITSVTFSPDGQRILTASSDGTARIWSVPQELYAIDAVNGEPLAVSPLVLSPVTELPGHQGRVNSAAYSSDGRFIVTACVDGFVRIFDSSNNSPPRKLGVGGLEVYSAQYSPDGRLLVTTSGKFAQVWDAASGTKIVDLKGHTDPVYRASFSADSRLIATSSADKTARVWEAKTGNFIAELRGHSGSVLDAEFSPDGKFLITTSEDYSARIYPYLEFAPFEELRLLIPQRVVRELTPQERKDYLDEPLNNRAAVPARAVEKNPTRYGLALTKAWLFIASLGMELTAKFGMAAWIIV